MRVANGDACYRSVKWNDEDPELRRGVLEGRLDLLNCSMVELGKEQVGLKMRKRSRHKTGSLRFRVRQGAERVVLRFDGRVQGTEQIFAETRFAVIAAMNQKLVSLGGRQDFAENVQLIRGRHGKPRKRMQHVGDIDS